MGMIGIGVWFLLYGLSQFVSIAQMPLILGVLAIVAGILVLAGR